MYVCVYIYITMNTKIEKKVNKCNVGTKNIFV